MGLDHRGVFGGREGYRGFLGGLGLFESLGGLGEDLQRNCLKLFC